MDDLSASEPEEVISFALNAVRQAGPEKLAALDAYPTPIYATDAEGRITWYNRACIAFSGRTPVTEVDRWCVTWKLFTTGGAALPHDQCPMAVAIREARPVRGAEAVAQRPDGSHVRFSPFPTPIFNDSGQVVGAVNMLVDVSQSAHLRHLRAQAERCRRLARGIDDRSTKNTLTLMARDYEERAKALSPAG
jgi:PAS domain-containing protein